MASSTIKHTLSEPMVNGWYFGFKVENFGLCVIIPAPVNLVNIQVEFAQAYINQKWTTLTDPWEQASYGTMYMIYYNGTKLGNMSDIQLLNLTITSSPKIN